MMFRRKAVRDNEIAFGAVIDECQSGMMERFQL
jgi:hypothetical protein